MRGTEGTLVIVTLRLRRPSVAAALGFGALCILYGVIAGPPAAFISLMMVTVLAAIAVLGFWAARGDELFLMRFLQETLEAREVHTDP